VIAFVGAVFSPAYFRSRRTGLVADPLAHCGLHVVVHGERHAWASSEWSGERVQRQADALVIGDSRIVRDARGITIDLDERTRPWGSDIRGRIRLETESWCRSVFALDGDGRHGWWPVAPRARIEVALERPALRFVGTGYHDANAGSEALEQAFAGWSWCRAPLSGDRVAVLYDVRPREGIVPPIGVVFDASGRARSLPDLVPASLGPSRWRVARSTRADAHASPRVIRSLVDAPFYARSLVDTTIAGEHTVAVHETVDLDRFTRRSTQWMLPFRIRGVGWR